jgi:hypothetical protein
MTNATGDAGQVEEGIIAIPIPASASAVGAVDEDLNKEVSDQIEPSQIMTRILRQKEQLEMPIDSLNIVSITGLFYYKLNPYEYHFHFFRLL